MKFAPLCIHQIPIASCSISANFLDKYIHSRNRFLTDGEIAKCFIEYTILPIENAIACYQRRQLADLVFAAAVQSAKQKVQETVEAQPEAKLKVSFSGEL